MNKCLLANASQPSVARAVALLALRASHRITADKRLTSLHSFAQVPPFSRHFVYPHMLSEIIKIL